MITVGDRRVQFDGNLDAVTRIDHAAECAPSAAAMTPEGINKIWSAICSLYGSGVHPGITVVIRRRGQLVMKRAIGCAQGNMPDEDTSPRVMDPDTPICIFSASKAISCLLVHKLAEDGLIDLDGPVADYVQEFGAQGKHHVTVRDLLSHQAGVPFIPREHRDPSLLQDWDKAVALICAEPGKSSRRQAYHALTTGFIIGELVQRVAGLDVQQALHDWIAEPLGCKVMSYGAPAEMRDQVARNAVTGPDLPWPLSLYMDRILAASLNEAVDVSNSAAFFDSVIPSANIHATADELCRVFEMLRCEGQFDGRQVLHARTVADAIRPVQRLRIDGTLLLPMRYASGFMMGQNPIGLFGPASKQAFGHLGLLSILGWADPSRELSVALLNTGKSLALPGVYRWFGVLNAISRACPPI